MLLIACMVLCFLFEVVVVYIYNTGNYSTTQETN